MKQKQTFILDNYYKTYKKVYRKKSTVNKDFLIWFIGFSEGDGSFVNRFIPQKK